MNGIVSIRELSNDELQELIDKYRDIMEARLSLCAEDKVEIRQLIAEMNRRARAVAKRCHIAYSPVTFNQLFA